MGLGIPQLLPHYNVALFGSAVPLKVLDVSICLRPAGYKVVQCFTFSNVVRPLPLPVAGEVIATNWRGKVELRHWERDGHPEIRDSAEAAAGGGQEPAGGK